MYKFIVDVYNSGSEYEQLKELPGTTDFPRAEITKEIFRNFLGNRNLTSEILEIGPGSGFITEYIAELIANRNDCELDLMDFSEGYLNSTRAKNFNIRNFICHDITQFEEDRKIELQYDFIFFQEVLEHLVSPFTALVNINNLLRDGGQLFLTLPNSGWWRNIWTENCRRHLLLRSDEYLDTHISEISVTGMVKLLNMTGFDILRIDYYCSTFPFFKSISSEQVGFLVTKRTEPSDRWQQLAIKNRNLYFDLIKKRS
jgi:2-polyprenyl-3-methyl-5-hydroxy-6-metoxy-1,4-benzoquinol methylase